MELFEAQINQTRSPLFTLRRHGWLLFSHVGNEDRDASCIIRSTVVNMIGGDVAKHSAIRPIDKGPLR